MSEQNSDQLNLGLDVVAVSKAGDDVHMCVLGDGTPYLTERGLAALSGVSNSTLNELNKLYKTTGWGVRPREVKIAEMLAEQEFEGVRLCEKITVNGAEINAYPEPVCMVILEYYAYETEERYRKEIAKRHCRLMLRKSFRDFVYQMTGYKPVDPNEEELEYLKNLRGRIAINSIPNGYFSVLEESYPLELKLIRYGLTFDQHTIPDGSIGNVWGRRWSKVRLDEEFGKRIKHLHIYPESYAQSKANGKIDAWVYPLSALIAFREWLQEEYIPNNLPQYLKSKVKQGVIAPQKAQALLNAVNPPQLPNAS